MLRQGRQTAQEGDCLRSAIHVGIVPDAAQEVGCDLFPIDDKGPQPLWRYQRDGEVNRSGTLAAGPVRNSTNFAAPRLARSRFQCLSTTKAGYGSCWASI